MSLQANQNQDFLVLKSQIPEPANRIPNAPGTQEQIRVKQNRILKIVPIYLVLHRME